VNVEERNYFGALTTNSQGAHTVAQTAQRPTLADSASERQVKKKEERLE